VTVPSIAWSGNASTVMATFWPGRNAPAGFLEVGVDIDLIERTRLASRWPVCTNRPSAPRDSDHAIDRRADHRERQVALGLGERGAQLIERARGLPAVAP